MSDINRREFAELALDGNNYLTWALDAEIFLASCDLSDTIIQDSSSSSAQKAKALIFLRHHLNKDLKYEYLTEKDPVVLWQSLKNRFDQQRSIVLPQAQYDWLNLRFQDFKSVIEYNSALHRIVSQLKFCKQKITEVELIEKTLLTFHASNLVLQQQYRAKNYAKHSELISALLVAEKHDQLLMRNHNSRPVGSNVVPEAHATAQRYNPRRGRGRGPSYNHGGRSWSHRGGRGGTHNNKAKFQTYGRDDQPQNASSRGSYNNVINQKGNKNKDASSSRHASAKQQICYRCGCKGHWSHICRTPAHLVEAYQRMQKDKRGKNIQVESHHASLPKADLPFNEDDDDLLKLELEDYKDKE